MEFLVAPGYYNGCLKTRGHVYYIGGTDFLLCERHRPHMVATAYERIGTHITCRWLLPDNVFHHRLARGCAECAAPIHVLDLNCDCAAARALRWSQEHPAVDSAGEDSGESSEMSSGED